MLCQLYETSELLELKVRLCSLKRLYCIGLAPCTAWVSLVIHLHSMLYHIAYAYHSDQTFYVAEWR